MHHASEMIVTATHPIFTLLAPCFDAGQITYEIAHDLRLGKQPKVGGVLHIGTALNPVI